MDWQPIETAPRDGRSLILGSIDGKWALGDCSWLKDHWHASGGKVDYPTHWQPLPEPPK